MKTKKIIVTLILMTLRPSHTAQLMFKNQANPQNFLDRQAQAQIAAHSGKMRIPLSLKRKNRPAPLPLPSIQDSAVKEAAEKQNKLQQKAIARKLLALQFLIDAIIEYEGEMLERDETLYNITSYINNPLIVNEHSTKMAYLESMEDRLTEKYLRAKRALEEKYYLQEEGAPKVQFEENPVVEVLEFSMDPKEMEAMHGKEGGFGRARAWTEKINFE